MVLEIATLTVKSGQTEAFEAALRAARPLIAGSPGFQSLELRRCIEAPGKYQLFVRWATLEDHTVGFRQGPSYPAWRAALHHFYESFLVEHYSEPVALEA